MPAGLGIDQRIEQALAWHRFDPAAYPEIRREFGVLQSEIDAALRRMDEAADYTDSDVRGRPDLVAS